MELALSLDEVLAEGHAPQQHYYAPGSADEQALLAREGSYCHNCYWIYGKETPLQLVLDTHTAQSCCRGCGLVQPDIEWLPSSYAGCRLYTRVPKPIGTVMYVSFIHPELCYLHKLLFECFFWHYVFRSVAKAATRQCVVARVSFVVVDSIDAANWVG